MMTCHDGDVMNRVVRRIVEIDGGPVRGMLSGAGGGVRTHLTGSRNHEKRRGLAVFSS
jgi:hypothetical protein